MMAAPLSNLSPPGVDKQQSCLEDLHESTLAVKKSQAQLKADEQDSGYEDSNEQDDDCLDSDMEGSVMHRPRPKKRASQMTKEKLPPAIPQRNERRASVMLDSMLLELHSLDGATNKDMETNSILVEENPLDAYLSSEEDASLSDDYEDSLLDTDMEDSNESGEGTPVSRPASRRSQEDTATIISFTMVGKPQIVEIVIHSPIERKRHTVDFESLASPNSRSSKLKSRRPSPLKLFPQEQNRRASIASPGFTPSPVPSHSTSYISPSYGSARPTSSSSAITNTPRKSSRLASLKSSLSYHNTLMNNAGSVLTTTPSFSAMPTPQSQPQHAFLNMDPFEAQHYHSPTEERIPVPKTPIGMTSAAWKNVLSKGSLSRTLSKARKPSMPKLNMAYKESNNASNTNLSMMSTNSEEQTPRTLQRRSATMPVLMNGNGEHSRPSTSSTTSSQRRQFEDLAKKVVRAPPPPPEPKQSSFRMTLSRKKSVKN